MDESTRSSSKQPRRRTLGYAPKEVIGDFTKDALDDGSDYQEHDSMGGMSCDVNSGHMEGVPDHLDLVSNHQIGMVSSLKAHEAAIFSYLD